MHHPTTKIMAILNATPDSFFEGRIHDALDHARQLIKEGADILDVGGESTRPGSDPVPIEEELKRVVPVIQELRKETNLPISIDTMKWQVAKAALDAGATMVNDVTGLSDPEMVRVVQDYQVPAIAMHMQGKPKTMQSNPEYPRGVVQEILEWMEKKASLDLELIFDPGIGFGKTVEDNLQIIHNLQKFRALGFPLLLGLSRKSFMQKILGLPASEMLEATLAMNTIGILNGADIIRVHDVQAHRRVVNLLKRYKSVCEAVSTSNSSN